MKSFKQKVKAQDALDYHLENDIPLTENVFRVGSESYYDLFREARRQQELGKIELSGFEKKILEETDIGSFAMYEDMFVPLDCPLMESEYQGKDVELNEPKRGGDKKFYVYVKNDKGNVVKVQFGDTSGLKVKLDDPEARKSFAARHQCDQKKDKTKPGYWACRLPYYAKQLGLSGGGNFFW